MPTTSYPRDDSDLAGCFVRDLAQHLSPHVEHITILAPGDANAVKRETTGNITVHRLTYLYPRRFQHLAYGAGMPHNLTHRPLAIVGVPGLIAQYARAIWKHAATHDLVHCHWGITGAIAARLCAWRRRPMVLTVHGSDFRTRSRLVRAATLAAARRAATVTTLSREFVTMLSEQLPAHAARITMLPNGTDSPDDKALAEAQRRRARDAATGALRWISVGRLIPQRRHDAILHAVATLRREGWQQALTIVGDGPRREALQALARELGITDYVRFTGGLRPHEVGSHLLASDIYVSATTVDNFGTAVVEAAAHGLPIVCTKVGFPLELVPQGDGGWLVDPDDDAALIQAMRAAVQGASELPARGAAMRRRVDELGLTWPQVIQRLLDIYRRPLAGEENNA